MNFFNLSLLHSMFFVFKTFLGYGLIFWSEGYVVIPIMQKEFVSNLHLLSQKEFIDSIGLSQLTPGPVTIIAAISGYHIEGLIGALVAIFAIFLPGTLLMFFISKKYEKIKNSNFACKMLNSIVPVIMGLLIVTAWQIGQNAIKNKIEFIMIFMIFILIVKFKVKPAILIIASVFFSIILNL